MNTTDSASKAGMPSGGMPTMRMIQHIPQTTAWILLGVKVVFFVLIILGNSFVLAVICRNRKIRSLPYTVYVLALAVVDLITGLFTVPMDIYKNVVPNLMDPDAPIPPHYMDKSLCLTGMFSINQILTWSSSTLMVIAADRLIATVWPLKYHTLVTHGRATVVLLVTWVVMSIPLYVATAHTDLVTYNPKKPCMMPYQYHPMLKVAVVLLWGTVQLVVCFVLYISAGLTMCSGKTQVSNQRRVTVMMAVIIIVFTVCTLPIMIINLIQINLPPMDRMTMAYVFFGMMHANSFANPIIYNVANKTFRDEFVAICRCRHSTYSHDESDEEKTAYDLESTAHTTETNKM